MEKYLKGNILKCTGLEMSVRKKIYLFSKTKKVYTFINCINTKMCHFDIYCVSLEPDFN